MIRSLRILSVAASAIALSGCLSGLLPEPAEAPVVYRLTAPVPSDTKLPGAPVVRVDNVSSPRTYNTNDVIVITSDEALSAAAGARWADDIPEMVQDAMLSQLAKSDNYIGVIPVAGARASLRLHLDIRDFAAYYEDGDLAAPTARVQVYATVSEAASRDFVGSFTAVGEAKAAENRLPVIVDAQSRATREALSDVVAWMNSLNMSDMSGLPQG